MLFVHKGTVNWSKNKENAEILRFFARCQYGARSAASSFAPRRILLLSVVF